MAITRCKEKFKSSYNQRTTAEEGVVLVEEEKEKETETGVGSPGAEVVKAVLPEVPGDRPGSISSSSHRSLSQAAAGVKCAKFLATMLRLARKQSMDLARNVENLTKGLVDGKLEPEAFVTKLPLELGSSQQPGLVMFLKGSLPQLPQM